MKKPPRPEDEARRLASLRSLKLLDTPRDARFDDIAEIAAALCRVPMVACTLIDADRQWFKTSYGMGSVTETARDVAFCAYTILGDDLLVVEDASRDPRFAENPAVVGDAHIRFYAGAPVRSPSGEKIGALCIVDTEPRELTDESRRALLALRDQLEALVALHGARIAMQTSVLDLASGGRAKVLEHVVHHIKNALTAVCTNAEVLVEEKHLGPEARAIAEDIDESSQLVARLVDDMLDLLSAQHGRALRAVTRRLALREPFAKLRRTFDRRLRDADVAITVDDGGVRASADPVLLQRVLDNVVDHALVHAPPGSEIRVLARSMDGVARIEVEDRGRATPAEARAKLLSVDALESRTAGLGLAFCRIAVTAQHGDIWLEPIGDEGVRTVVELRAA